MNKYVTSPLRGIRDASVSEMAAGDINKDTTAMLAARKATQNLGANVSQLAC